MYDNILVAYDGSEYSKSALKEAVSWTKKHGGKAFLVHGVFFDEEEFGIAPVQLEKRLEHGTKLCQTAKKEAVDGSGMELESIVCEGDPPNVIQDIAHARGADLIAIGTRGRKGIRRIIMGSVTANVIMDAPCDVLVVKGACSDCAGTYRNILVPYDGSQFSVKALETACQLAKQEGAKVTALYVVPRYEELIDFIKTESVKKSLNNAADKVLSTAKEQAAKLGVEISTEVLEGHAADMVVDAARGLEGGLVVMGGHGWKGVDKAIMGSTAERVIINAPCPVLVAR